MARSKKQHKGLGDTVEAVLEKTGASKLFHIFVDGEDCGCDDRKEILNNLFPYRFKARCLTEQEYNDWKEFKDIRTLKLEWKQVIYVCDLYASVFNRQKWYPECHNCSGTVKTLISMIDKLDKVYNAY